MYSKRRGGKCVQRGSTVALGNEIFEKCIFIFIATYQRVESVAELQIHKCQTIVNNKRHKTKCRKLALTLWGGSIVQKCPPRVRSPDSRIIKGEQVS